jgi:class 3 adenylate cyclase/YHS domain-containing protein
MTPRSELSIDELAACSAETADDVRGWQDDGLLATAGLTLRDVERIRLIRALERRGLSHELIVTAFRNHADVIDSFLDEFSIPEVTEVASAAEELTGFDLDSALLERVLAAGNMQDAAREPTFEDLVALRTVRFALQSGFPEDPLLQLIRVYRDALGRVADAEVRLFHIHVHQGLYAQGLRGAELAAATNAAGKGMGELIEPTLLYFHRKAWKDALRDDLVLHVLEELGIGEPDGAEGRIWRAVVFTDLSSFTPLTDVMGDATAAAVLDRFSTRIRAITRSTSGTVVKQIGDSFMTVFLNAGSAVTATLELLLQLREEPQFPAIHAGIHYGPLLYREGDYVGGSVNVAARLLTQAGPNEIAVSGPARRDAATLANAYFEPRGFRSVKGLADPIEVFTAHGTDHTASTRKTDPICGMQLRDEEIAARTSIGTEEYVFCSTTCMGLFAAQQTAGHRERSA